MCKEFKSFPPLLFVRKESPFRQKSDFAVSIPIPSLSSNGADCLVLVKLPDNQRKPVPLLVPYK